MLTTEEKQELNWRVSLIRGEWEHIVRDCPDWDLHPLWVKQNGYCKSCDAPPNWTGDEAANAILLEEMALPRIERTTVTWVVYADWRTQVSIHGDGEHKDRKVAVVLAWLAWKEQK